MAEPPTGVTARDAAEPVGPAGARVGVDVGGTFTDVVVQHGDSLTAWKVPSSADQSAAFARGVSEGLARAGGPAPGMIAHGTTVATNAVLERRGARTALLTTEGFRDVLVIGRQNRPSLYDLWADRPAPIVPRELAVGIPERVAPDGAVVRPLDEEAVRNALEGLVAAGAESLAVCLLFSFANPAHERRIRDLAASAAPGMRVSLSSDVLPEFREYERASTTALDAYVGPVVERYLAAVAARAGDLGAPVVVMRSGGGTMTAAQAARKPVQTMLSGPAAGVLGAARIASAAGIVDAVTFDMGGTSTDVCLLRGGEPAISTEGTIGGLPFRTPAMAVHTIGAGGGSIVWLDEAGALRVGPHSAGGAPGPACYGAGGADPTITDAHAVLGHLDPGAFLGGRMHLDVEAAARAFEPLARGLAVPVREVAAAALAAVRARMAAAIRVVSVERGADPRDLALVAFGGAGPMHATALAAELEMRSVLVPPAAGVLSALGLVGAPLTADASLTRLVVDPGPGEISGIFRRLGEDAAQTLRTQGAEPARVVPTADCRYRGQAHEVTVDAGDPEKLASAFATAHRDRFGWDAPGEPFEVVTFRVRAVGAEPGGALPQAPAPSPGTRRAAGAGTRRVRLADRDLDVAVHRRADLLQGDRVRGPCVVTAEDSTIVVDPGWEGAVDATGALVLRSGGA